MTCSVSIDKCQQEKQEYNILIGGRKISSTRVYNILIFMAKHTEKKTSGKFLFFILDNFSWKFIICINQSHISKILQMNKNSKMLLIWDRETISMSTFVKNSKAKKHPSWIYYLVNPEKWRNYTYTRQRLSMREINLIIHRTWHENNINREPITR